LNGQLLVSAALFREKRCWKELNGRIPSDGDKTWIIQQKINQYIDRVIHGLVPLLK
jgi:hypothetical protein